MMEKCREQSGGQENLQVLTLTFLIAKKVGKFWKSVLGKKERFREQ